ncbi:helix-turn-helix domain-containing protein [Rossellomorea marisflavi]|uniref:helix-turn-helix domain-containing protein n=1 Tax=Rossellomorea marisflavi TaxID=189381 RepID=UPI001E4B6735|nr:helix-turn-helix domain-containing protein [Rossellomorea marisflavi]
MNGVDRMGIEFKLGGILEELKLSKNALAVEGKIRPATVAKYETGDMGRIEIDTLVSILDTLNRMAAEKGVDKTYSLEDLIEYKYEGAK